MVVDDAQRVTALKTYLFPFLLYHFGGRRLLYGHNGAESQSSLYQRLESLSESEGEDDGAAVIQAWVNLVVSSETRRSIYFQISLCYVMSGCSHVDHSHNDKKILSVRQELKAAGPEFLWMPGLPEGDSVFF